MLKISELFIYPIKSLSGIAVQKAQITEKGFAYDRRWLLVDMNNCFLTQREHAQMALLSQSIEKDVLRITHKINKSSIIVALNPQPSTNRGMVTIWDDTCIAEFISEEADDWFSEMLGLKCRLVYMPDDCRRIVDQQYAPED